MSKVRPVQPEDLPQLIDLNTRLFPGSAMLSREEQEQKFTDVFFRNPWRDPDITSLVYEESSGKIGGFFGIVPRHLTVNGEKIRAGVGQHLMVEGAPLASLQLYRAWVAGPQELSIADLCNDFTRKLMETVGGTPSLIHSIWWKKMLRPTSFAVSYLQKSSSLSAVASLLKPFSSGVDGLLNRPSVKPFHISEPTASGEELTIETMLTKLKMFTDRRSIQPDYTEEWLTWLFGVLGRERRFGTIRKIAVSNREGVLIGWFVYYLKPGGKSEVLQIAASKGTISEVLDYLFYDAWTHDSTELSGRIDPAHMKMFYEKFCFFALGNDWMVIKGKRPELVPMINAGDAFLSRVEGDLWFF
jgi:hypothetical protein